MRSYLSEWAVVSTSLAAVSLAFSSPPESSGFTVLKAALGENTTLSYKQISICETTAGVNSYSGYIHLPPSTIQDYETNIFFLYFESRTDPNTAPLGIWLGGGPGESSTFAAFSENGPCLVQPDSQTTKFNPHSWNNEVDMLYIDQPVSAGFSYDFLVNGTIDSLSSSSVVTVEGFTDMPDPNATFLYGTFSSQQNTANNTASVASAVWDFLQVWTQEFPPYTSSNDNISLWSESYGGLYVSAIAAYILQQNDAILGEILTGPAQLLRLSSVGILNGYVDMAIQAPFYPEFAYSHNTYGVQAINKSTYEEALAANPLCQSSIFACRAAAGSPVLSNKPRTETETEDNTACAQALILCFTLMQAPFSTSGRNPYDISLPAYTSAYPRWAAGYLNQASIQQALGTPLNFTQNSPTTFEAFAQTGDGMRGGALEALGLLLDRGIRVALVYGDLDYQCNWLGGEAVGLAVNSSVADGLGDVGYADLVSGCGCLSGKTRQVAGFSFSRVFAAGHGVAYRRPEIAYDVFSRTVFGLDVATGTEVVTESYATEGPVDVRNVVGELPGSPASLCYLWSVLETCSDDELALLEAGLEVVEDFILVGYVENGTVVRH